MHNLKKNKRVNNKQNQLMLERKDCKNKENLLRRKNNKKEKLKNNNI